MTLENKQIDNSGISKHSLRLSIYFGLISKIFGIIHAIQLKINALLAFKYFVYSIKLSLISKANRSSSNNKILLERLLKLVLKYHTKYLC